ncbi:MAG: HYR domain-containing protein, partial [Acidimicrobiales bacterium]
GNVVGFPVGGGTETILVPIVGDTSAEGDEYFRVTISSDGAEVTGGVGVVRIVDDDALRVSVLDAPDVVEGDSGFTEMAFTVVLDSAPSGTVRVRWETHDIGGAAQPDDPNIAVGFGPDRDFDANLGTLTFSADGPLTQQVVVHVRGDEQDEFTENVHLLLREVSGAGSPVIGDGVGVGRIIDDDDLPSRPDIEPPVFVGNADLDVTLPDGSNKVRVYWSVLAEDVVDGRVSHDCSPAVKSFFLVGETEIICVATDAAGNEATASFTVTVVESDQRLTDRDGRLTNEGRPGSFVNVQAAGFLPGSQVLADLRSDPIQLALLTADDKGIVDAELSLPLETTLGAHTIALIGIDSTGGSRHALFPTQIIEQTPDPTCTITGTPGNDRLFGTRGDDVICGLGGNDRIFGRGGNDILLGGPGDDRLSGGNGRDVLYGEAGDDVLRGDRGADRLVGDDGEDRLVGGRGADEMFGGRGADEMRGGTGGDQMYGGSGDDVLRGGPGNDELNGGPGDDKLRGNSGRDRLSGKSGNDDVRGGPGRDTIF